MNTPLKIWIAGASGFCGRSLVKLLAPQKEWIVLPHIRPSSSRIDRLSLEWKELGLEPIICEWSELEDQFIKHGPDVVVSFLGTTKKQARYGGGDYQEVDLGMNQTLIRLAQELELTQEKQPTHFIYLSSMGSEWGQWNAYLRPRLLIEETLQASCLTYSIIKPGILHGETRDEKRFGETIGAYFSYALARFFSVLSLENLAYRVKPLDATEIAQLVQLILKDGYGSLAFKSDQYTISQIHTALSQSKSVGTRN